MECIDFDYTHADMYYIKKVTPLGSHQEANYRVPLSCRLHVLHFTKSKNLINTHICHAIIFDHSMGVGKGIFRI